jgi:hypothetical protein
MKTNFDKRLAKLEGVVLTAPAVQKFEDDTRSFITTERDHLSNLFRYCGCSNSQAAQHSERYCYLNEAEAADACACIFFKAVVISDKR